MARSDEAEAWFAAVCEVTQQIPQGRVTSYGHIAMLVGRPDCPRQVGIVMKSLPSRADGIFFHNQNVPWQRVVNSKGIISPRKEGGAARQAQRLESEGVEVSRSSMGELSVSFAQYGWFPASVNLE